MCLQMIRVGVYIVVGVNGPRKNEKMRIRGSPAGWASAAGHPAGRPFFIGLQSSNSCQGGSPAGWPAADATPAGNSF
jgi:hypothetical protein